MLLRHILMPLLKQEKPNLLLLLLLSIGESPSQIVLTFLIWFLAQVEDPSQQVERPSNLPACQANCLARPAAPGLLLILSLIYILTLILLL